MNAKTQNKLFLLINGILCGFSALYLTCILDQMTLVTNLQRMFVWCYFFILFFLILWFVRKKIILFVKQYIKIVIICVFVLLGWSLVSSEFFLPKKYLNNEFVISILEENNNDAKGKEAWLQAISLDGEEQPLDLIQDIDEGWTLNGNVVYGSYDNSGALVVDLPEAKTIKLTFGMHLWSGIIEIQSDNFDIKYDLYDAVGNECVIEIPGNNRDYVGISRLILLLGYFSLCVVMGELVIFFIIRKKC